MLLASCKVRLTVAKIFACELQGAACKLQGCKVELASCKMLLASCKADLRMSDQIFLPPVILRQTGDQQKASSARVMNSVALEL